MLKMRKNKKTGGQSSDILPEAPKLSHLEKKRPASPEVNLERKKRGTSSGISLESELNEDFPLQIGE